MFKFKRNEETQIILMTTGFFAGLHSPQKTIVFNPERK